MSAQAFERDSRRGFDRRTHCGDSLECNPESSHPRVYFQMNRLWRCAEAFGRTVECLHMLRFPNRGSQISPDDLLLFSSPEAGHEQNSPTHARFSQGNAFIGRGHAQPFCSGGLKRQRALGGAVTICIRLDHRAHLNVGANQSLHHLKVSAQSFQRDFGPCWAGKFANSGLCDRDHNIAIISARPFLPWLRECRAGENFRTLLRVFETVTIFPSLPRGGSSP